MKSLPLLLPLEGCTLFYLSLPSFLFFAGWMRPTYGIPICLLLGLGLGLAYTNLTPDPGRLTWKRNDILLFVLVGIGSLLWLSLSGVWGLGLQNPDYLKHNAVFKDLIEREWPVRYGALVPGGPERTLSYYLAYYLPAALVGKGFGWEAGNFALLLWSLLGLILAALWAGRILGTERAWWLALFPFLGGLDVVGYWVFRGELPGFGGHLEWWLQAPSPFHETESVLQYSSNTALLYWVPQHCLPCWVAAGSLVRAWYLRTSPASSVFLASLCFFWSPFAALGLLPFVVLSVVGGGWKKSPTFQNVLLPPLLAFPILLFFQPGARPPDRGWFWEYYRPSEMGGWALLLLLLEIGFYAILVAGLLKTATREDRLLWWTSVACLVLIPLYRMGLHNDWAMRVSIPSLYVFWLFALKALSSPESGGGRRGRALRFALGILLLVGSYSPLSEMFRSYREGVGEGLPVLEETPGVLEIGDFRSKYYLGFERARYFRYLAPPPKETQ